MCEHKEDRVTVININHQENLCNSDGNLSDVVHIPSDLVVQYFVQTSYASHLFRVEDLLSLNVSDMCHGEIT